MPNTVSRLADSSAQNWMLCTQAPARARRSESAFRVTGV